MKFSNDNTFLNQCLEEANICILHTPLFHPAMKEVAPVRRELGLKTFFNMLGPMVNPAFPKYQMVGVFNLELLRIYSYLYQNTDKHYSIVHELDGYDEISLTSKAKIIRNNEEMLVAPSDFNLKPQQQSDIFGGETIAEAATIFTNVLQGKGTPQQNNVVCANAAIAISTVNKTPIKEAFALAKESLESGKALEKFNTLIALSKA